MSVGNLYDLTIDRKEIFPLWIFSDPHRGKHTAGKFICFIGGNWPVSLAAGDDQVQLKCINEELRTGKWKMDRIKEDPAHEMVGWGFGNTPTLAFRHACYMSGHIQLPSVASTKA